METFFKCHELALNRFYSLDRTIIENAWEAISYGESIDDDRFLVDLDDQKRIFEEFIAKARSFNNKRHTEIYFIEAKNGGGKSQMSDLLVKNIRNPNCITIKYDLSKYEDLSIEEMFQNILEKIWNECKSTISNPNKTKEIQKQFDEEFVSPVKSGKFIDRINAIKSHFTKGIFILIDEFDSQNENQILEWAGALRNISDHLRGTLWIFMTLKEQLEILCKHKTSARYVDIHSSKNIYCMNGRYKDKIIYATAKLSALYEKYSEYEFNKDTLNFIASYIKQVKDIGIYKSIREANSFIIERINDIKILELEGIIKSIYKGKKRFKKSATNTGDKIEKGCKNFLERNIDGEFILDNDTYKIRYDKENLEVYFDDGKKISDGQLIIDKERESGWTKVNRIPVEIKSTISGDIPKAKINKFAENGGVIPVIAGWLEDEEKTISNIKNPSYPIRIPDEFSLLLMFYPPDNIDISEKIDHILLDLIALPGIIDFAEKIQKKKNKADLMPTEAEILASIDLESFIQKLIKKGLISPITDPDESGVVLPPPPPKKGKESLIKLNKVGKATQETLYKHNLNTIEDIANANIEDLIKIKGIGQGTANTMIEHAKKIVKKRKSHQTII